MLNRHPPDDGVVEAKIATFDGFWQCQTLDTGLSCSQPVTLARRAPKMPNLLSSRRTSSVGFECGMGVRKFARVLSPGLQPCLWSAKTLTE